MDDKDQKMLDAQMEFVKMCNTMMDKGMQPPEVAATLMALAVRMYHSFLTKDEFCDIMDTIKVETSIEIEDESTPTLH